MKRKISKRISVRNNVRLALAKLEKSNLPPAEMRKQLERLLNALRPTTQDSVPEVRSFGNVVRCWSNGSKIDLAVPNSAGQGKPCGESHIASEKVCRVGESSGGPGDEPNKMHPNYYHGESLPDVVFRGAGGGKSYEQSQEFGDVVYVSTSKKSAEQWGVVKSLKLANPPKVLDLGDWNSSAKGIVARANAIKAGDLSKDDYDVLAGESFIQANPEMVKRAKAAGYDGIRLGADAMLFIKPKVSNAAGKPCGESHIASGKTCHVGEGKGALDLSDSSHRRELRARAQHVLGKAAPADTKQLQWLLDGANAEKLNDVEFHRDLFEELSRFDDRGKLLKARAVDPTANISNAKGTGKPCGGSHISAGKKCHIDVPENLTWQQLGYDDRMAAMAQKRYGKPAVRQWVYKQVSDSFKAVPSSGHNLSTDAGWMDYYKSIFDQLEKRLPGVFNYEKDAVRLHKFSNPKSNKTVIGLDAWDWVTDLAMKRQNGEDKDNPTINSARIKGETLANGDLSAMFGPDSLESGTVANVGAPRRLVSNANGGEDGPEEDDSEAQFMVLALNQLANALDDDLARLRNRLKFIGNLADEEEMSEAVEELLGKLPDYLNDANDREGVASALEEILGGAYVNGLADVDGVATPVKEPTRLLKSIGIALAAGAVLGAISASKKKKMQADIARRADAISKVLKAQLVDDAAKRLRAGKEKELRATVKEIIKSLESTADKNGGLKANPLVKFHTRLNAEMASGYGVYEGSSYDKQIENYPFWEFVRVEDRIQWREWPKRWVEAGGELYDEPGDYDEGRMFAKIGDQIWYDISRWNEPYPPFDYNSGMGLRPVSRTEAIALGIMDVDEEIKPPHVPRFNEGLKFSMPADEDLLEQLMDDLGDDFSVEDDGIILNSKGKPCGDSHIATGKTCHIGESPESIGQDLGLEGKAVEMGGIKAWQFTNVTESPTAGLTFYVPEGSNRDAVAKRWIEKQREFSAGTQEFRDWFGKSAVIDAEGKPLVVYHGTSSPEDFKQFERTGTHDPGYFGKGFYFSPKAIHASVYAMHAPEKARIVPVYLAIQNPFRVDSDKLVKSLKAIGIAGDTSGYKLTTALKDKGYDGVIVDGGLEYVAFSPTQIKSVHNKGTWNKTDPNISNSYSLPREYILNADAKLGCLMAMVPESDVQEFLNFGKHNVDPATLTGDRLEDQPHVTALFGFKEGFDAGRLKTLLADHGPIKFKIGKLSRFTGNPEYDVLKFDVESPELIALNAKLREEFEDDLAPSEFPEYNPHLTVAYVKPGTNEGLDGAALEGKEFEVDSLLLSGPHKTNRAVIVTTNDVLSNAEGKPCGESHIASDKICRIGEIASETITVRRKGKDTGVFFGTHIEDGFSRELPRRGPGIITIRGTEHSGSGSDAPVADAVASGKIKLPKDIAEALATHDMADETWTLDAAGIIALHDAGYKIAHFPAKYNTGGGDEWRFVSLDLRNVDINNLRKEFFENLLVKKGNGKSTEPIPNRAGDGTKQPTDAQLKAGNYAKLKTKFAGMAISIETPMGSERHGFDADGKRWGNISPADYGYLTRQGLAADGDPLDVYLSHNPSETAPVFVVDQIDPATGNFDESKVLLGFPDKAAARVCYVNGFSDGSGERRLGEMTEMTIDEFKRFLKEGDLTKPFSDLKVSNSGKPCGDSHISADKTCRVGEQIADPKLDSAWKKYEASYDDEEQATKIASAWVSKQPDESIDLGDERQSQLLHESKQGDAVRRYCGQDYIGMNKSKSPAVEGFKKLKPGAVDVPLYRGLVFRGEADFKKFINAKPGSVLKPKKPLASFSASEKIGMAFSNPAAAVNAGRSSSAYGILLVINKSKSSRDVGRYGQHHEQERVFVNQRFKVTKVIKRPRSFFHKGFAEIHIDED